jgi:hypothetical protein
MKWLSVTPFVYFVPGDSAIGGSMVIGDSRLVICGDRVVRGRRRDCGQLITNQYSQIAYDSQITNGKSEMSLRATTLASRLGIPA